MGLIKDFGMRQLNAVHEHIRNPINDAFITHYIMGEAKKGKGKPASSSRAPPPQPEQQNEPTPIPPNAPFDFASYAQWQHESNMHT